MTPLHVACGIGNHDSVEQLIKEGRQKRLNVQAMMKATVMATPIMAIICRQ